MCGIIFSLVNTCLGYYIPFFDIRQLSELQNMCEVKKRDLVKRKESYSMTNPQQSSILNKKRLSPLTIFEFALGSFGLGLVFSLANTYFIYFVTDVALVDAGIMSLVFTLTRVFDFCCTPIIAGFIQNGRFKHGKYRSWILYIIPITSFFTIFCFVQVKGMDWFVAFYYAVMYLLAYGLIDKAGAAQRALMTRMASNDEERMKLTARTAQFEQAGNIVFSLVCLPLVALLGNGSEAVGFRWTAVVFAVTGFICWYITAHAAKPYDIYYKNGETAKGDEKSADTLSAKECAMAFFKNPPMICSMLIELFRYIGFMVYVSTMAYYFKWVIGDMAALTGVATASTAVCFISSLIAPKVSQILGRKNSSILAMALYMVGLLLPRFVAEGNVAFYTVCICLGYFGSALQVCVGIVMYSKAADWYQWKTGKKAHGFIMSMYVLPVEVGIALSTVVVGIVLKVIDYDATAAALTAVQLTGVKNLVLLIPGIFFALATLVAALHPLSERKIKEMHQDMRDRGMEIVGEARFEEV